MRLFGIIAEQGLIGIGNFLVSWIALRHLTPNNMAIFALVWSVAWSLFAVISETLLTPLRVEFSSTGDDNKLSLTRTVASLISTILVLIGIPLALLGSTFEVIALVLMALAIPVAAVAFYSARSMDVEKRRSTSMIRRGTTYALCTLVGLLATSTFVPRPEMFTIVACISLILAAQIGARQWRRLPHGVAQGLAIIGRTVWTNRAFGLATALRVTLFSSGLLLAVGFTLGSQAVAVFAAVFVLISPIQLASSSLPWLLLGRQARLHLDGKKFRAEMWLQLLAYTALGLLAAGVLALLWQWWTESSIADQHVRQAVHASLPGVLSLLMGVLLTSWSSTLSQVLRLKAAHLFSVICGGAAGLIAVVVAQSVILAAVAPYAVSFAVSSIFVIWKASKIGNAEPAQEFNARQ